MRFLYVLLVSLLVVSCSSVPKSYLETNNLCKYDDPIFTITKEELTFDIKKYGAQLKKKRITLIDNDSVRKEYWLSKIYITYLKSNKSIGIDRLIKYDREEGKIVRSNYGYINGKDDLFKETYYNKDGSIKEIIDYNKGYKICWAEAIAIVKKIAKQEIKRYGVTQFYAVHNNLNRGSKTKKALWFVGFMDGNDKLRKYEYKKGAIRYKIDGVTGKFLGTHHIITEHN